MRRLDCQQVEFQIGTIERHAAARNTGIRFERVQLDASAPPPWFVAMNGSLPMLKWGRRVFRGQEAISERLASHFPTIRMEQQYGVNHGFVRRFKSFEALATELIECECVTTVRPPAWGGPQMEAIRQLRGADAAQAAERFRRFQQELQYVEGLLRAGEGPYLHGKQLTAADWALGPRLQTALLGVRHFLGWDLPVPPFTAIHAYRAALKRHAAFPRLLHVNPKLMAAYHQKTIDDLVRQRTKESLRASGLDTVVLYVAQTPRDLPEKGVASKLLRPGTLNLLFGSDQARFHFAVKDLRTARPPAPSNEDTGRQRRQPRGDVVALEEDWLVAVRLVEVSPEDAGIVERNASLPPTELEPAETAGFFAKAVNFVEDQTGIDIDGDGDVGVVGSKGDSPSEFLRAVPSGELPALVHGSRVVCGANAVSDYLEEAFETPKLTPELRFATLRPRAVGELFPAAMRYMYTPRTEAQMAQAAKEQFESQLAELESCLTASGGPYLYGQIITIDDCRLGPQLQSALVALEKIKGWRLVQKTPGGKAAPTRSQPGEEADTDTHPSFPAIQRYRNAIARHAKFPSRPTAEILALHEASIDTFVAEQLDRSRETEDAVVHELQSAIFGPRTRWRVSVTVVACRDLRRADMLGKNDPYVVVTVGDVALRTSTLTDAGSDPVWGLKDWDRLGSANFVALRDPEAKARLLEEAAGETLEFDVAFPVPALCHIACMDADFSDMNPDDVVGCSDVKLGDRDRGGGNLDCWAADTWLALRDEQGQPSGQIHVRIEALETSMDALLEPVAPASHNLPADLLAEEWNNQVVGQIARCAAATDRAESATRVFSGTRTLENFGRLLDLPVEHPTGWGWDARLFVNCLHDRAALLAVQQMAIRPAGKVLMVGAGAFAATLHIAQRLYHEASQGRGMLCVTDPSPMRLRDTRRALSILNSAASPVDVELCEAAPNMVPPCHPNGRELVFPETMAMDPDLLEMSSKELKEVVERLAIHVEAAGGNTTMMMQQAIMRHRRDKTWGVGADAHSHLPFRAATFDALVLHPSLVHLRSWEAAELLRLLRPEATATIVLRPWPRDVERMPDRAPGVPSLHDAADVCNQLRAAGFTRVAAKVVRAAEEARVQGFFFSTAEAADAVLLSREHAARTLQSCCERTATTVKTHLVAAFDDLESLTPATEIVTFSGNTQEGDSLDRGALSLQMPGGGMADDASIVAQLREHCPKLRLVVVNACNSAEICHRLHDESAGRVSAVGWSSALLDTDATRFEIALFLELETLGCFDECRPTLLRRALDRAYAVLKEDARAAQDLPQPTWLCAQEKVCHDEDDGQLRLAGESVLSQPHAGELSDMRHILPPTVHVITAEVPRSCMCDPNCLLDAHRGEGSEIVGSNEPWGGGELRLVLGEDGAWGHAVATQAVCDLAHLRKAFPARRSWYQSHPQNETTMHFEVIIDQSTAGHLLVGLAEEGVKLHEQVPVRAGGHAEPAGLAAEETHQIRSSAPDSSSAAAPSVSPETAPKTHGKTKQKGSKHNSEAGKKHSEEDVNAPAKSFDAQPKTRGVAVWSSSAGGGVRCTESYRTGRWGWGAVSDEAEDAGPWKEGDVIGVTVWRDSLQTPAVVEAEFSKNGRPMCGALRIVCAAGVALFPAFSGVSSALRVNFGRQPHFEYKPPRLLPPIPRPLAPPAEIEPEPGETLEEKRERIKEERLAEARRRAAARRSEGKAAALRKKAAPATKATGQKPKKKKPKKKKGSSKSPKKRSRSP